MDHISRTSQNIPKLENKCIVPIYNIPQPKELYNSAKIQNKISKDLTLLNISKHVCFMRRARMWILINHPEPSTLIVKLFHRHQCACEYKRSIICEKARVYSTYINLYTCKNAMQPTHQKHRSTWITSVEHHKISQN